MSQGITVKLSADDFQAAWQNGEARHRHHCERKNRAVREGGLTEEAVGTVGEMAVARLLGVAWNPEIGPAHYGSDDAWSEVCGALEVKATMWATGRLLVYPSTADTLPVILAIVNRHERSVRVPGWIAAADGKRPEWWEETFRIPCWAIPQHALRPIEELSCFQRLLSQPSSSPPAPSDSEITTGAPANWRNIE